MPKLNILKLKLSRPSESEHLVKTNTQMNASPRTPREVLADLKLVGRAASPGQRTAKSAEVIRFKEVVHVYDISKKGAESSSAGSGRKESGEERAVENDDWEVAYMESLCTAEEKKADPV
mmetsp:Transcript_17806/g.45165  ORF Transcript_17806/g.45165 Transcript_17806/m.45165 type:complete len:120 (+) Transcript_17806:381-740(+)|eukprot:CAMPEP_0174902108 /NCGR_PEP_ID=MMETSP0167-20121228/36832_1 /TAXON_ID=38298 /ORGANISM="Rhodella maculata, Strain CCMP736" /LENGTH=119 /DNA_ID=CAMNT_0016144005 /DNA_START=405 /DNA_END=764 /DNA_ORIENTATION=-